MYKYHETHYRNLIDCYKSDINELSSSWGKQRNPNTFLDQICKITVDLDFDKKIIESLNTCFPWKSISVDGLQNYCKSEKCYIKKIIAIFAWGGMNEKHFITCMSGRKVIKCKDQNKYIIDQGAKKISSNYKDLVILLKSIQRTDLSRKEIFKSFKQLNLSSCKIAYFTKLMFFLAPKENWCFILDQWTGRSVNLLLDSNESLIKMNYIKKNNKQYVNDRNTEETYGMFCNIIEDLSLRISSDLKINFQPHQVEQLLFSRPNPNKLSWRKYVEQNG